MNKRKNPRKTQFNVRVTVEELEILRRNAWDCDQSISNYVREILGASLKLDPQTIKNNA